MRPNKMARHRENILKNKQNTRKKEPKARRRSTIKECPNFFACMEAKEQPTQGFLLVKDGSLKKIAHFAKPWTHWAIPFACNEDEAEGASRRCYHSANQGQREWSSPL